MYIAKSFASRFITSFTILCLVSELVSPFVPSGHISPLTKSHKQKGVVSTLFFSTFQTSRFLNAGLLQGWNILPSIDGRLYHAVRLSPLSYIL